METQSKPGAAPKPPPKWQRWLTGLAGAAILVAGVVKLFGHFYEANHLPDCDSQRAKDTLSDIFGQKNMKPTGYNEIKTISSAADKVVCRAELATSDPSGTMHVDYEFFWEGSDAKIKYEIFTGTSNKGSPPG